MWEPRADGTTDWAIYGLTKQLGVSGARQYTRGAIFAVCAECTGLVSGARSIDDWIAIISRSPASVGQSEIRLAQTALAAMSIFDEAILLRPDQLDDFHHTFADIDIDIDDADRLTLEPRHAPP
jgi:hypothetical protein